MTHGVDGGVSGFGGVRVRRNLRINRMHRGFFVRRAMSVRHRRLVSFIEAFESFPLRHAFMGKGVDFRRLQTRPTLLHFHSVAACVRCVVELQDPLLESRVFAVNYHPRPRIGNNLRNRSASLSAIFPEFFFEWGATRRRVKATKIHHIAVWAILSLLLDDLLLDPRELA